MCEGYKCKPWRGRQGPEGRRTGPAMTLRGAEERIVPASDEVKVENDTELAMECIVATPCKIGSRAEGTEHAVVSGHIPPDFVGQITCNFEEHVSDDVRRRFDAAVGGAAISDGDGCTLLRVPDCPSTRDTKKLERDLCECIERAKAYMQPEGLSVLLLVPEQTRGIHQDVEPQLLVTGSSRKNEKAMQMWHDAVSCLDESRDLCSALVRESTKNVTESFEARRRLLTEILATVATYKDEESPRNVDVRRLIVADSCHTAFHKCINPRSVTISRGAYDSRLHGGRRCVVVGNLRRHGVDVVDMSTSRSLQRAVPARVLDVSDSDVTKRVQCLLNEKRAVPRLRIAADREVVWKNKDDMIHLHNLEQDNALAADVTTHSHLNVLCAAVPIPTYYDCESLIAAHKRTGIEICMPATRATLDLLVDVEGNLSKEAARAWAEQETNSLGEPTVRLPIGISDKMQEAVSKKYE